MVNPRVILTPDAVSMVLPPPVNRPTPGDWGGLQLSGSVAVVAALLPPRPTIVPVLSYQSAGTCAVTETVSPAEPTTGNVPMNELPPDSRYGPPAWTELIRISRLLLKWPASAVEWCK